MVAQRLDIAGPAPRTIILIYSLQLRTKAGTRSISRQSVQSIAEAAQRLGQEDDITVLPLSYLGVPRAV